MILPFWGTYYMPAYYYAYTPMVGPTVILGGGSIAGIVIAVFCFICVIALCAKCLTCCNRAEPVYDSHHYEPEM